MQNQAAASAYQPHDVRRWRSGGGRPLWKGPAVHALPLAFLLVVALLAGCGSEVSPGARPSPTFDPSARQLDAYFRQQVAEQQFSGSVLIAHGGTVLLNQGYGYADMAQHIANAPQTQFRIGSLTKGFTAASILLLQARGKLSVGDPICRYLTDCPSTWQAITIQELLTHTSGIPDLADNDIADYTKPLTSQQLFALIRVKPLAFAPGSHFLYSSAGYNVLGVLIERVSGESYADFVQHQLFSPYGLAATRYDASAIQLPEHATGYSSWGMTAPYLDMTLPFAAGGLASTTIDLYQWSRALDTSELLDDATRADMLSAHVSLCSASAHNCPGTFTSLGYGYGWFVGTNILGRVDYHQGDLLGFRALLARYPDRDFTVVVLANVETVDMTAIQTTVEGVLATNGG